MTGNLRLGFHAPATVREISDIVAEAANAKIPLEVRGRGSKYEVGRYIQSGSVVSTEHLVGISLYEPTELVMSAGAGTPLDDMYPSREYARQDTAVLHVSGHDWPPHVWFACPPGSEWWRGNDRLHEKLAAIGVPHTADLDTPGPPGSFLAPMLAFVVAALGRESRRLV